MTYEEAHRSPTPAAYVTFQFGGQEFDKYQEFVVGNKAKSSSTTRKKRSVDPQEYENKPLQPNTNYRVFLRAFVSEVLYPPASLCAGLKMAFAFSKSRNVFKIRHRYYSTLDKILISL